MWTYFDATNAFWNKIFFFLISIVHYVVEVVAEEPEEVPIHKQEEAAAVASVL